MERVAFSQMFTARGTASWKSLHLSHWAFIWRGDWIGRVRRIAAADRRAGPIPKTSQSRGIVNPSSQLRRIKYPARYSTWLTSTGPYATRHL